MTEGIKWPVAKAAPAAAASDARDSSAAAAQPPSPTRLAWTADHRQVEDGWLAKRRTVDAIAGRARPVAPTHVYAQYVNGLKAKLAQAGLPISAEGVRIVVMGEANLFVTTETLTTHTHHIVEVLKGPLGFARGSTVDVLMNDNRLWPLSAKLPSEHAFSELGQLGMRDLNRTLQRRIEEVRQLRRQTAPGANQTTLVNLSQARSPLVCAATLADYVLAAQPGSVLAVSAKKAIGHRVTEKDRAQLESRLFSAFVDAFTASGFETSRLQLTLDNEVSAARSKERLLIFQASGNLQDRAALGVANAELAFDTAPSMITIGAIDIGHKPHETSDDRVAAFSVKGPVLGAVGTHVPVSQGDVEGTSFATPFVVSVAALMIKANPALTPDQIETILKKTSLFIGDQQLREVDVVAAVAEAKKTAPVK